MQETLRLKCRMPQIWQYFGMESKKSACENHTDVVSAQTPCDEKKATAFWKDENAVKTLIYQWVSGSSIILSLKVVSLEMILYGEISEELKKANSAWQYTAKNCENKFKDITKVYKRTKDHHNQTGVKPKTCKYFEELEEVLGKKPCLKPVALASSLRKRPHPTSSSSASSDTDNTTNIDDIQNSEEISIKSKKPKKMCMERELKMWTKTMSEENKKRDEAKERRHQELLIRQDRAR